MYGKKSTKGKVSMPMSRPRMGSPAMNVEQTTGLMVEPSPIRKPVKRLKKTYNGFTGNYSTD